MIDGMMNALVRELDWGIKLFSGGLTILKR